MIKATVEHSTPRPVKSVTITLDDLEWQILLGCLESHANNLIINGRVVNCMTARQLREVLIKAVETGSASYLATAP